VIDEKVLSEILLDIKIDRLEKPKYRKIQMAISQAIMSGTLQPGQKLPADKALANILNVSLGTVQKALINLKETGAVTRSPKRGTIINDHVVDQDDIYIFRFRDQKTNSLIPPEVRMLAIDDIKCEGSLCDFFQCKRLVSFQRILRVGMEPPVYSEVFVPFEMAEGWVGSDPDKFHGLSVHRFLHNKQNKPILRTENRLKVASLDEKACYHMMKKNGTIGMIWEIHSYSYNDLPCTFQRIQLPTEHRPVEFMRSLSSKNE
jgi:DNA-binding GntR family transcriptional regulator